MVVDTGGEFHDLLISKNDNVQLLEYTDRLSLKLHILFYKYWGNLYSPSEIGGRHRAIVESIRSKDLDRIEKVVREHYHETGSKIAALWFWEMSVQYWAPPFGGALLLFVRENDWRKPAPRGINPSSNVNL